MSPTICPACGEAAPDGANWCEACGADLAAGGAARSTAPCVACGQADISADGYCMSCGHRQPGERDRVELTDGSVVAVTDKGLRHHHNEDAVAIAELDLGGAAIVVCDGVSSTPGSAEASAAAARAALDVLVEAGRQPDPAVTEILLAAAQAAQEAATAAGEGPGTGPEESDRAGSSSPPSSTFVAAIARPVDGAVRIHVAWLGDSRAYWIDAEGATLLTEDHELNGSLTRWIGADADGLEPEGVEYTFTRTGLLVVCSDGLWRYAEPASDLHALIRRLIHDGANNDPLLARHLVRHALDSGGHDNISVALWAWAAPTPTPKAAPKVASKVEGDDDE